MGLFVCLRTEFQGWVIDSAWTFFSGEGFVKSVGLGCGWIRRGFSCLVFLAISTLEGKRYTGVLAMEIWVGLGWVGFSFGSQANDGFGLIEM